MFVSFCTFTQVVVGGEVIEYISLEMGVVRLTGGDVALFHLSQVFFFETPTRMTALSFS